MKKGDLIFFHLGYKWPIVEEIDTTSVIHGVPEDPAFIPKKGVSHDNVVELLAHSSFYGSKA